MSGEELLNLLKAGGLPGFLIGCFIFLATKTDLFKRDEPQRSDVLSAIDALRHESAAQNREISAKVATLEGQVTDRLARVETTQRDQARRVERLEDRRDRG